MDADRLIAEVYKRPALWNQRDISYHNRDVTNRIWMEIASLLKLPKQLLKTKWKGLRDTFRAEIKKEQAYRKTKFARNRPVWVHFHTLQFLKEQMLPRPPIWERASCPTADSNNEEEEVCENGDNANSEARAVLRSRSSNSRRMMIVAAADTTKNNRRGGKNGEKCGEGVMTSLAMVEDATVADIFDEANNSMKNNDRNKLSVNMSRLPSIKLEPPEHCELDFNESNLGENENPMNIIASSEIIGRETPLEDDNITDVDPLGTSAIYNRCDDNYYFFISLLPHMRSLPAERRMLLRMKIQQLVYEEVYQKTTPPIGDQRNTPTTETTSAPSSPLWDKHS